MRNRLSTTDKVHVTVVFASFFCALLAGSASGQEPNPFGGRPRFTQPTVLSPVVTDMIDGTDSPSISGDGLTIYYDGYPDFSKHPVIWQATRPSIDSEWENAQRLSDAVNSSVRQLEADVTADGLELYFRSSDVAANYDSLRPDDSLMVAIRTSTEDEWGEAERLPDSINSLPCLHGPTVTGDGLELYFSSVDTSGQQCRQGRYGDIYVSKRATRDDAWEEPQLVEPLALWPGISPDGLRLYFNNGDSAARKAEGLPPKTFENGPAVWVRTRNSRDEEFGPHVELADPPNTSSTFVAARGPEASSDGSTLYFASDRPGAPSGYGVWQTTLAQPCDINADGSCDVDDLTPSSLFRVNLVEGSELEPDVLNYDISGDGRVDENDLDAWLAEAASSHGFESAYLLGDANLDGSVNAADLNNLALNWRQSVNTWSGGDFTADGFLDAADLNALALNWQQSIAAAASSTSTVPEPSTTILLAFAGIGMMIRRLR